MHLSKSEEGICRAKKEGLLKQKGLVIWFTGLSGSGKTTLALALEQKLFAEGILTRVLDGDEIRTGLCKNVGFGNDDRKENIRRIAEVAKLFCTNGIVTLAAFISPTIEIRSMAKEIIGNSDFFEVYLSTPIETCELRDTKGLYKKARTGQIKDFTGISAPYEAPLTPDLTIDTTHLPIDESVEILYKSIIRLVRK